MYMFAPLFEIPSILQKTLTIPIKFPPGAPLIFLRGCAAQRVQFYAVAPRRVRRFAPLTPPYRIVERDSGQFMLAWHASGGAATIVKLMKNIGFCGSQDIRAICRGHREEQDI